MQKYTTRHLNGHVWIEPEVAHGQEFYLVADVDAQIAELERELAHVTRQRDETAGKLQAAEARIQALTFGATIERK